MLDSESLRCELGARGRKRSEESINWETDRRALLAACELALQSPKKKQGQGPKLNRLRPSARAAAEQHDGDRPEQDFPIERQRPLVDVFQVQLHPAPEAELAAAFQGP